MLDIWKVKSAFLIVICHHQRCRLVAILSLLPVPFDYHLKYIKSHQQQVPRCLYSSPHFWRINNLMHQLQRGVIHVVISANMMDSIGRAAKCETAS